MVGGSILGKDPVLCKGTAGGLGLNVGMALPNRGVAHKGRKLRGKGEKSKLSARGGKES